MIEEQFRAAMANASLSHYTDEILNMARNSIRIECEPACEDDFGKGQSKLGGLPDLPHGIDWPTWTPPAPPKKPGFFERLFSKQSAQPQEFPPSPHSFVAQFNLAEVAPYDTEKKLPASGMLYFFFDTAVCPWGFNPADRGAWKVLYWNGDISQLSRTAAPPGFDQRLVFKASRPTFSSEKVLPPWESLLMERLNMSDDESTEYIEMLEDLSIYNDDPASRLLGHPDQIQGDMLRQCQLVTNDIYVGNGNCADNPRVPDLLKSAADWQLLFQIDSQHVGTNYWGDAGRIYYWTRSYDLAQHNLDNIWLVLQCY